MKNITHLLVFLSSGWQCGRWVVVCALCLLVSLESAYAKIDVTPITPPKLDYTKHCTNTASYTSLPKHLQKDWSAWDGKPALSVQDLITLGRYYSLGRDQADYRPQLAAKMLEIAAKGDSRSAAQAKSLLGTLYLHGKGVAENPVLARDLLEQASTYAVRGADYQLGVLALKQNNVSLAVTHFKRESSRGSPSSFIMLAQLYDEGKAIPDSESAVKDLFFLAQNQLLEDISKGDCLALYRIGLLYESDRIIPRNAAIAQQWFEKAADANIVKAMLRLASLYRNHSTDADNTQKIHALWQRAAKLGSLRAMTLLGEEYLSGITIERNPEEAVKWLTQSALRGDNNAEELLVQYYNGHYGDKKNLKKVAYWLEFSSKSINPKPEMLVMLGDMIMQQHGDLEYDPKRAFALYQQAARLNDDDAILRLARAHMYGLGTQARPRYSLRFYRLSASLGNVDAMRDLEHIFTHGVGVTQNEAIASRWRDRSIVKGSASSMITTARQLHASGQSSEAFSMLERAAEEESREAYVWLAVAYQMGIGTEVDTEKATLWSARALAPPAGEDAPDAQEKGYIALANHYWYGYWINKKPQKTVALLEQYIAAHPQQAASAKTALAKILLKPTSETHVPQDVERGIDLLLEASAKGHIDASAKLADMSIKNELPDSIRATLDVPTLLRASAEQGNVQSIRLMGRYYMEQRKDYATAFTWYTRAATLGDLVALTKVGELYEHGLGVDADMRKALSYYEQAAEQGHKSSARKMGLIYLYGNSSISAQPEKGIALLQMAADKGDIDAMLELANAYASGFGVSESSKKALYWWQKAADNGSKAAQIKLKMLKEHDYRTSDDDA